MTAASPRPAGPARTALLVIDMQNDYVHRDGASLRYFRARQDGRPLAAAGEPSAAEQIVPCLRRLVDAARASGVAVVWVRTIVDEVTASPTAVAQGKRFAWAGDDWGTAFFEGLVPLAGEPIVTKGRHSAFFGTHLDTVLGRLGARTLVLTGVSTPYCIEGTARDAFARDLDVVTVADATASKVAAEHAAALDRLGRVFGRVTAAAALLHEWERSA